MTFECVCNQWPWSTAQTFDNHIEGSVNVKRFSATILFRLCCYSDDDCRLCVCVCVWCWLSFVQSFRSVRLLCKLDVIGIRTTRMIMFTWWSWRHATSHCMVSLKLETSFFFFFIRRHTEQSDNYYYVKFVSCASGLNEKKLKVWIWLLLIGLICFNHSRLVNKDQFYVWCANEYSSVEMVSTLIGQPADFLLLLTGCVTVE